MKNIPMQLKVNELLFDQIKRMARYQAAEKDEDISWQDLVREALSNAFPVPREMNNGRKENIA